METKSNILKQKTMGIIQKIKDNPKQFFYISLTILSLNFIFSLIKDIYYPPKSIDTIIPSVYNESDEKIDKLKAKELKLEKIVQEMKVLADKRAKNELTREDSLQAEYLISKYNKLKNGL